VQFKVDGANLGAEDTTAPYSISWNTMTVPDGTHTLTAVARDAARNITTSAPVTIRHRGRAKRGKVRTGLRTTGNACDGLGTFPKNPSGAAAPQKHMRAVVIVLVLLLVLALGSLELIAARGVPDANVPGAATADILRSRGIHLEP